VGGSVDVENEVVDIRESYSLSAKAEKDERYTTRNIKNT
jgi:hypothetical protein